MTRLLPVLGLSRETPVDLCDNEDGANTPMAMEVININDEEDVMFINEHIDLTDDFDGLNLIREVSPEAVEDFEYARAHRHGLPYGHTYLRSARGGRFDILVKPEMGVSLEENDSGQVHFLWIKDIVEDHMGQIYVEGISLKRNRHIFPKKHVLSILPRIQNDVTMDLKTSPDKLANPLSRECFTRVALSKVDLERKIVFTNHESNAFGYLADGMSTKLSGIDHVEEHGVLRCRTKYAAEIIGTKQVGGQVMWLNSNECDTGKGIPDAEKRRGYGTLRTNAKSKYTLADLCAGAGAVSRAGKQAGLSLSWALDDWNVAIDTLRVNFPGSRVLKHTIQDFTIHFCLEEDYTVDIIHISFPCQGHSKRNRNTNPDRDAKNNETILILSKLLMQLRPRAVTLEQTNGIMYTNDGYWFRVILAELSTAGYNLRWRTVNMAQHGVPQARHRTMIMATCPGQTLPDWPAPTHGDVDELLPLATINDVIQGISPHDLLHDIDLHKEKHRNGGGRQALVLAEMDSPLRELVDTGGAHALFRDPADGAIYWPTFRQQMRLQTFPDDHYLVGYKQKDLTTQIGNAVPCVFMKQIFKEVIKALKKSDREAAQWQAEVVVIDR